MFRWLMSLALVTVFAFSSLGTTSAAADIEQPVGVYLDGNIFGRDPNVCRTKLEDIKNQGFDSVQWANGWEGTQRECLVVAEELGIDVYFFAADTLYDNWWRKADVEVSTASAKQVVQPILNALEGTGVDGYHVVDEPSSVQVNHDKFVHLIAAFQELTDKPVFGSHNVTASWFPNYQRDAKPRVWEAFSYPIQPSSGECTWINTHASRTRSAQYQKPPTVPFWEILQSHGASQFGLRAPTVPEIRALQWVAVGNGADGIFWFIYDSEQGWTGLRDARPLFEEAGKQAVRYKAIREDLRGTNTAANIFRSSNSTVVTYTLTGNNRTFGVAVNTSCSANTRATITASQIGDLTNLETGFSSTRPVVDLRPGDAAIFELGGTVSNPTPSPSATPSPSPSISPSSLPTPRPSAKPSYCSYWWAPYVYPECR